MDNQGIDPDRYAVVPRTLVFIRRGGEVLLVRRPGSARVWPGRMNGVGGHVEAGEDLLAAARREVLEEIGLEVDRLHLGGVLHVSSRTATTGAVVFLFTAEAAPEATTEDATEGTLHWMSLAELDAGSLVPDLPAILPRLWPTVARQPFVAYSTLGNEGDVRFADLSSGSRHSYTPSE